MVKRLKHKAKEPDQEMLQDMTDEAPIYVTRWTVFSSLTMTFFIVLTMFFLIKKNSTFHLLKWLSCEAQHVSKDLQRL